MAGGLELEHTERELSPQSRLLALQLLQEYDGHVSTQLLLALDERVDPCCQDMVL